MNRLYTISAFTENNIGLLGRITIIFTRRRINIESLSVSETERKGVSRFTIVIKSKREVVEKLVKQIRKIIEVLAVFGYENEDLVFNELAFFKIRRGPVLQTLEISRLADQHEAKLVLSEENYHILEKAGTEEDIYSFFKTLKPFGIMEFVRSGRISLAKNEKGLSEYLPKTEWEYRF
jgi:acetolactate synthase I/III small subunit